VRVLILSVQKLAPKTADETFKSAVAFLEQLSIATNRAIVIHFNQLGFVDPYGLACIWLLCRLVQDQGLEITLSIPNFSVQSYLHRMGLFRILQEDGVQLEHDIIIDAPLHRDSVVLLEATRLSNGVGTHQVAVIVAQVAKILHSQLDMKAADIANVCTTLSEACLNVLDHSDGDGIAAAQSYSNKDKKRYVMISVVDAGRGIRASLSDRFSEVLTWDHKTALLQSLQKHYSRFPDRGLGLYQINQIVTKYSGSLHIRSGDTRIYIRQRAIPYKGCQMPGTQICISLSTP
jgi:anti-sigma regulatory factor (Ser/Thr protein kinase)/anti-anti-sigma regulatory factor